MQFDNIDYLLFSTNRPIYCAMGCRYFGTYYNIWSLEYFPNYILYEIMHICSYDAVLMFDYLGI